MSYSLISCGTNGPDTSFVRRIVKATFVLQLPGERIERQVEELQNRLDLKLTSSDISMSHVGLSGKFRRRF